MTSVKNSDIHWLGKVASDWEIAPAWRVMKERGEKSLPDDVHLTPSQTHGVLTQQDYMDRTGNKVVLNLAGTDNMKRVRAGDFIIHLRSFQGGIEASAIDGKVSNAYTVLTPAPDAHFGYYRWFMKSVPLIEGLASSTDQLRDGQSINFSRFSRLSLPLPPLETQRRIADYLDRETAEIDAAVADLDKYVELLEKRRTLRLIEETRIRSSARMTTIGRHAQVSLGKTLQSEQKSQNEQLVNYVRAGNIQPNGVFDGEAKQMWMTPDEQSAYSLLPGDVLVVEGGAGFGRSLTLNLGLQGWGFQNHVIRIRPQSGWIGKFIDYSIRAHKTDGLIDLLAVGATIPGFSADKARNLPIAFLTEREQSEVVQTLDKDMDEIDFLIAESTRLRDLLLKRRSVLITEVVTGRKQV